VALEERVLLGIDRRARLGAELATGPPGALARDDRAQAAEWVYA
jgi:hypothetical protein